MGFLGTTAEIIIDVNLIIQWIVFVFLLLGYLKRGTRKTHGTIMATATIVNLATVLVIMAPALIMNWGLYEIIILGHVAVGTIAIILGLLYSFRFLMAIRSGSALACGNRGNMRLAFVLWIVPVFFGTYTYLTLYVFA
jgi:uncharacterized membrane protein YozB (DUF420 family)